MTNQWGRDGLSTGRRSGSLAGLALGVAVSLVIGVTGGYALARFATMPDRQAESALQQERDTLAEQVRRQSAELDDLTLKLMATDGNTAKREQAADADLRKLQDDLAKANEARGRIERDNTRLTDEAKKAQASADDLSRQLDTARQDVEEALRAREAATRQAETLATDLKAMQARLNKNADEAGRADAQEIARLRALLSRSEQRIAGLTADLDKASDRLVRQQNEQDEQRQKMTGLDAALDAQKSENARLQATLDALRAPRADETDKVAPAAPADSVTQSPQPPRSADAVEAVLVRTPGLGGLTAAQRDTLKRQLVDGACVANALEAVFGRVPLVTMRDMVRDLQSGC